MNPRRLLLLLVLALGFGCDDQQRSDQQLLNALRTGDTNQVSEYCESGGDPNRVIQYSSSRRATAPLLDVAIFYGQHENVKCLLKWKADPNLRDSDGWTPIIWVVSQRKAGVSLDERLQILYTIANNGGDLNLRSADIVGWTPLCLASKFGDLEMVKALITLGADVNKATFDGQTPLKLAPNETITRALVDAGSN